MPTQVQAVDVFDAISSPVRREVLDLLRASPQSAGELAAHFDMRRPSVSQHLRTLREAELVRVEVDGRRRIYHVVARPLREVASWLHPFEEFWRDRMDALGQHLDDGPGQS